ncbi:Cation-transporting P-type ATPase C-terminal domain-containing protein [Entamoeba marina]
MILWANLVVDIPPSICLGLDPAMSNIMDRKPRDPNSGIFTWKKALLVLFQGMLMSLLTVSLYFLTLYVPFISDFGDYKAPTGMSDEHPNHSRTLAFIALSVIQLIHAFISKSITDCTISKDLFRNKTLIVGIFVSFALLVCGLYIPYFNDIVEQYPLMWLDWIFVLVVVCIHFVICELVKLVLRLILKKRKKSFVLFHDDL